jgi:class 3 adenylate cyclase/tetratricopeptide (TPR) repeat protein
VASTEDKQVSSKNSLGSRRFLTLLFADLCDSSRLAANVDAEVFAEVLQRLREIAREMIARHGGRIARIQGDGVLAVFGHPTPTEDDARRATEAAIDLRDAVESLRVAGVPASAARIGVHAGIHAGLVFVIDGDIERGRFDLVGDTANTAARLCSLAEDGDICVSESTLGPAAQFFVGEAARDVAIKGHDEPLSIRKIIGRALVRRLYEASASKGLTGFVGRDGPWSRLHAQFQRTVTGAVTCTLVTGQPGLGKTRLVEEFARAASAAGATVLRGFCESYLSAEPLQPFLQMLRAAAVDANEPSQGQVVGATAPVDRLLAAIDAPTEVSADPRRAPATIAGWVGKLAARQAVLIVLDDWQWADDASRQTLDLILSLRAPVFALVASRTAAAAALGAHEQDEIELAPLDPDDASAVAQHWLPDIDPFLLGEINAYAGGIPLFVEELCHAVASGSRLQLGVPAGGTAWLSSLIESRVARLDDGPAQLLRVAAVLGAAFPAWLFERVTGCQAGDARLRTLAEQDFLFPADLPGLLRFKHGLTRDAVYATVGLAERQRLHGLVAGMLESESAEGRDASLEGLAYHLSAAGEFSRAAVHAEGAGDKAMASNALDSARAQYTAALRDLDGLPSLSAPDMVRWCSVAQKLGMACVFDPISIPDREHFLERAVTLAGALGDTNIRARAEYWLGYTRYAVGRARAGLPHCLQALELAQASGDNRLAAQVRATLGQSLTAVARYAEALPLLDEAIDTKKRGAAPGGGIAIGSAYALANKGLLLSDHGEFVSADSCFAQALALLGGSEHPVASSVCGLMSIALLWQGRWDEAIRIADEGARIARNSRSRQLLALCRSIAGYGRWMSTSDKEGKRSIQEATQWVEVRGGRFVTSLLYGWQIDIATSAGAAQSARRHAARLLLRARDGDRIGEAMGCRAMARLALTEKQPDEASRWLGRAEHSAIIRGAPHEAAHNDLCRSSLLRGAGQTQAADELAARACAEYRRLGMPWHLERALNDTSAG